MENPFEVLRGMEILSHKDSLGLQWVTFCDKDGKQLAPFSTSIEEPRKWLRGFLEAGKTPPKMFPKFGGY